MRADMPQSSSSHSTQGAVNSEEAERAERKRKKREKKEREAASEERGKDDLLPLGPSAPHREQMPEFSPAPKDPWASKKPNRQQVEEVRQALGVGDNSLPPLGAGHMRGGAMGRAQLSTPPGDGLGSVGRARVKPGIRLEPLKAP